MNLREYLQSPLGQDGARCIVESLPKPIEKDSAIHPDTYFTETAVHELPVQSRPAGLFWTGPVGQHGRPPRSYPEMFWAITNGGALGQWYKVEVRYLNEILACYFLPDDRNRVQVCDLGDELREHRIFTGQCMPAARDPVTLGKAQMVDVSYLEIFQRPAIYHAEGAALIHVDYDKGIVSAWRDPIDKNDTPMITDLPAAVVACMIGRLIVRDKVRS